MKNVLALTAFIAIIGGGAYYFVFRGAPVGDIGDTSATREETSVMTDIPASSVNTSQNTQIENPE